MKKALMFVFAVVIAVAFAATGFAQAPAAAPEKPAPAATPEKMEKPAKEKKAPKTAPAVETLPPTSSADEAGSEA